MASERFEFTADEVGTKTGGEERAVDGSEFFVIDFASKRVELALDALTDDGGFVMGFGRFSKGSVYVAVGHAASAEIASDTEFALFADFSALARELFGVTGVVELARFFESGKDDLCEDFRIGTAQEFRFHFVDGVGATHQDAKGVGVEVLFVVELARPREHARRVKHSRNEVKRSPSRPKREGNWEVERK